MLASLCAQPCGLPRVTHHLLFMADLMFLSLVVKASCDSPPQCEQISGSHALHIDMPERKDESGFQSEQAVHCLQPLHTLQIIPVPLRRGRASWSFAEIEK